jgi:hypothetical protein
MPSDRDYCPTCGAGLVSEPIGAPQKCRHCGWHLLSRAEWDRLSPFRQGFAVYMQSAWPRSELRGVKNPHAAGTKEHDDFVHGEHRAMLDAQDGEE